MADTNPNLKLWDAAFSPPPERTKRKQEGSFKCTAIDAMWRYKAATELFGPCGIGWGWRVLEEDIVEGHPLQAGDTDATTHTKIHWCRIVLWYDWEGKHGELESYGQTTMVGTYGRGDAAYYFTDEEAPKKSLTDAIGKGLSFLGIGGAVYDGKFDADKYVQRPREVPAKTKPPTGKMYDRLKAINSANTAEALTLLDSKITRGTGLPIDDAGYIAPTDATILRAAIVKRREEVHAGAS